MRLTLEVEVLTFPETLKEEIVKQGSGLLAIAILDHDQVHTMSL